jgi:hypothetical protein
LSYDSFEVSVAFDVSARLISLRAPDVLIDDWCSLFRHFRPIELVRHLRFSRRACRGHSGQYCKKPLESCAPNDVRPRVETVDFPSRL